MVLYVRRWLAAPVRLPDGTLAERDRGTPQGSAISPVLANLFMHYAFDAWMAREFPAVPFERYADDAVVHCKSERQARHVRQAIADRMADVGLRLHPDKTKIVYCKDSNRRGSYEHTAFTFLGFTFRQRRARNRHGRNFSNFLPAISKDALNKISAEVRSWRLHLRTGHTFKDLARRINPIVAGWMQYYGAFYRSALSPLLQRINAYLMRWIRKKYKRLRGKKKARECWQGITGRYPNTRDFRCLGCREVFLSSCSVSVLKSVSVMVLPGCGHGCCPRVAAGLARGSTVRVPRRAGRFLLMTVSVLGSGLA